MSEHIFTDQNFDQEVMQSKEPVLVDFWAPWCGPCKVLSPIVEEVAKEYAGKGVKVGKINVDENPATAGKFGVMSIPTLIYFKNGDIAQQTVGVQDKAAIKQEIAKLL
ncbi:MAG: thioredoxin [Candidatus Kerfeldbacteria bacterium RIFCSPHIGHO2_12_FULL_48_17]|uniref:Thioredoxin n=1 Tax=Candidatus Kerfeldbacteria bacterium RIFCSPHIGHO2_12_FULL_48_17 TaxID=1798542 RepID=A0A1G2B530_9BACT|nr:MAG: thioredoxin [Candidatus Kerfeldbacteria bacterium RIFCSPHIGHO2_12_FULL_48_17]